MLPAVFEPVIAVLPAVVPELNKNANGWPKVLVMVLALVSAAGGA